MLSGTEFEENPANFHLSGLERQEPIGLDLQSLPVMSAVAPVKVNKSSASEEPLVMRDLFSDCHAIHAVIVAKGNT